MNKSIIVYGRDISLMIENATRMVKHFNLKRWQTWSKDEPRGGYFIHGVLVLVYSETPPKPEGSFCQQISFAEVAKQINDAIPLTDWQSGPPPMLGEWNASAYQDPGMRRWWNGDLWSMGWSKNHHQDTANQRAKITTAKNFSERIFWRGLSEEPIVVQGGA